MLWFEKTELDRRFYKKGDESINQHLTDTLVWYTSEEGPKAQT